MSQTKVVSGFQWLGDGMDDRGIGIWSWRRARHFYLNHGVQTTSGGQWMRGTKRRGPNADCQISSDDECRISPADGSKFLQNRKIYTRPHGIAWHTRW